MREACWAHIRRKFCDAIPSGKKDDLSEPAVQGVQYCDKLFAIECYCRENNFTHEKRHEFRNRKAPKVLEAFWSWLDKQNPTKGSRMDKAVTYALNQKPYAETHLQDGRSSLSNNSSENNIRPFMVGRKNWLFCDTPGGAHASATVYTMVEIAKAHGLNVENIWNSSSKEDLMPRCQMKNWSNWRPGAKKLGSTAGLHSKLLSPDNRTL